MNTVIWIFQALLAALFVMPAYMKLTTPTPVLIKQKRLSADGNPVPMRILGFLEALGVIGIILPQLINIGPVLTPVTAVCFDFVMIGAFFSHLKKREYKVLPVIVLAFILSATVAYYRFSNQ